MARWKWGWLSGALVIALFLTGIAKAAGQSPDGVSNPHPQMKGLGEKFRFAMLADPQVSPRGSNVTDLKQALATHNRSALASLTLRGAIGELNAPGAEPGFTVYLGDLVGGPTAESFEYFYSLAKELKSPTVLVHGNHDSKPPYTLFRETQKKLNGLEAVYYSFDAGRWHFVVVPCNFEGKTAETAKFEQGLLEWLAKDLEANKGRPTVVFNHLHMMPQGQSQLEFYTFSRSLRGKFLDLLAQHGNVKYYFNGHVHNGIQASVKTAWTWRGINFITVPTIILTRPFGEEYADFAGGYEQGGYYLIAEVDGDKLTVNGRCYGLPAQFVYPSRFMEFEEELEPRWLKDPMSLAAAPALVNGNFESGLEGWKKPWRYKRDVEPSFVIEADAVQKAEGKQSARIKTAPPGGDWGNDEYNELYQMVATPAEGAPVLKAQYRIETMPETGGGYLRIHGIAGETFKFLMLFHYGQQQERAFYTTRAIDNMVTGDSHEPTFLAELGKQKRGLYFALPAETGRWHHVEANIEDLYDRAQGRPGAYKELGVNKLMIAAGTWGWQESNSTAWFDDVVLSGAKGISPSMIDGEPIKADAGVFKTVLSANFSEGRAAGKRASGMETEERAASTQGDRAEARERREKRATARQRREAAKSDKSEIKEQE